MTKRLFIAADIDDATRDAVDGIGQSLRKAIGGRTKASWVRPERMHLTLQFFGEADAAVEQRIRSALAEVLRERPFELSFEGLGIFPERGSPRVLWLGIQRGVNELRRVQQILQDRLALPLERESFKPHLTLARFRERVSRARLTEIGNIRASAGPTVIDRVTLYESRLSPASLDLRSGRPEVPRSAGPAYLKLAEAPLQP